MLLGGLGRQADHVHPLAAQHLPEQVQPRGAVVVAADQHDLARRRGFGQVGDEAVEQRHGLRRGNGLVVDVPGDDHGVRLLPPGEFDDLIQYVALVLAQIPVDQPQPDVQVG